MQNSQINQYGVGLVEVLVAMLLLAVGVLGFSATQLQALKATDESLMRSDAMNAMRSLSEDIRINPTNKINYFNHLQTVWNNNNAQTVNGYCNSVQTFKNANAIDCADDVGCSGADQAIYNAHKSMEAICQANMVMNAIPCPGTQTSLRTFVNAEPTDLLPKICFIVSWNNTLPEAGNANTDCISDAGAYKRGSSCIVLESY